MNINQIIEDNKKREDFKKLAELFEASGKELNTGNLKSEINKIFNTTKLNPFIVIFLGLHNALNSSNSDQLDSMVKNKIKEKVDEFINGKPYDVRYEFMTFNGNTVTTSKFYKSFYADIVETIREKNKNITFEQIKEIFNAKNGEDGEDKKNKIDPLRIIADKIDYSDESIRTTDRYSIPKIFMINNADDLIINGFFALIWGSTIKTPKKIKESVIQQLKNPNSIGSTLGSRQPNFQMKTRELRVKIKKIIFKDIQEILKTEQTTGIIKKNIALNSMIHYSTHLRVNESSEINNSLNLIIKDMYQIKKKTKSNTPMLPRQELGNIEYQNKFMQYFCNKYILNSGASINTSNETLKFFNNLGRKIEDNILFINTVDIKEKKDTDIQLRENNEENLNIETIQHESFINDYETTNSNLGELLEVSLRDFGIANNLKELLNSLNQVSQNFIKYGENFDFYKKIWESQDMKFYDSLDKIKNLSYTYKPLIKPNVEIGLYLVSIFDNIEFGSSSKESYDNRIKIIENYLRWRRVMQKSDNNGDAFSQMSCSSISGGTINKIDKINNELKKIKKLYKSIK
jgi:hypothetical protein